LQRCRASGRKLILVGGRKLDDLRRVFQPLELFDLLVLENGGVLLCDWARPSFDPVCGTLVRDRPRLSIVIARRRAIS